MDEAELFQYGTLLLVAFGIAGAVFALAYPYLSGDKQGEKRIQSVTENRQHKAARRSAADVAANRRKAVAETLKDIEKREKQAERVTIKTKLQRAGIDATPNAFWVASIVCGLVCGAALFISMPGAPPLAILGTVFVGTLGLPRWILAQIIKRRQAKFLADFANAIDVIVRGVKSGLPLNECLGIIARESPEPLRSEFKEVVDQQRVGVTLTEALERMMARVPLPEVKFFAIVIGIQQQAGGNLSEALGNLSGVLRDRKSMSMKVSALSAEAKASAGVLASLPFIVTILVYLSSPKYILLLFTTKMGNFLLMGAAVWMFMGVMIMRKMINFKY